MFEESLEPLFDSLAELAGRYRTNDDWPSDSLRQCGEFGVFRGLVGRPISLDASKSWTPREQTEVIIRLSQADLLTTFVITQHLGAIKRMVASERFAGTDRSPVLDDLLDGHRFASVGISHLTTSRQHLSKPAVAAHRVANGYRLNGTIPWVTGADQVDMIVAGATLPDEQQILVLLDPTASGCAPEPGAEMIAMSASCTGAVRLDDVLVEDDQLLAGPATNVLTASHAGTQKTIGAGGVQTSALALGLSSAALKFLSSQAESRHGLQPIVQRFQIEHDQLRQQILSAVEGDPSLDPSAIRSSANSLVNRTTNAAMTTAKGAGMMAGHPVGRWCGQSLFFLVWSCPQVVAESYLCELSSSL